MCDDFASVRYNADRISKSRGDHAIPRQKLPLGEDHPTIFFSYIGPLPHIIITVTIYSNIVKINRKIPNRLGSNAVFDGESHGTIFRYRSQ